MSPGNGLSNSENEITLGLLKAVETNAAVTQRSMAEELGIALGLANTYLKRCVRKGFVKINQVPRNRYAYYLTPKGFAEKSKLTAEFLSQSMSLFRQAQIDATQIFRHCEERQWKRLALVGTGDITDIFLLCSREFEVSIVGIVGDAGEMESGNFAGSTIVNSIDDLDDLHACIVTDMRTPQELYNQLIRKMRSDRVLAPKLLELRTHPAAHDDGGEQ